MRSTGSQRGFTMIEVMVSLGLFAIVSAAMAPSYVMNLRQNTDNQIKTSAIAAAQEILDELRLQDPSTFPTSGSDAPVAVNVGERTFDVTVSYCTNAAYCPSANTRHLKAEVVLNGKTHYRVETVFTKLR